MPPTAHPPAPPSAPPPAAARRLVLMILVVAFLLRLPGIFQDLPTSYYGDELHFMKRAMVLGTGDLNPHWFHKPAALMYLLTFAYGLYFAAGYLTGAFESTHHFAAHFLTDHAAFLLIGRSIVLASGLLLVYAVYRLGRRLSSDPRVGLVAALVAALMPPLVASSQQIKADLPCALLIVTSMILYLRSLDSVDRSLRLLVWASLVAGVAMGTKYYGIILVPTYCLWELGRALRRKIGAGELAGRLAVISLVFVVGFFAVSPFNFLDPTWGRSLGESLSQRLGMSGEVSFFEPDAWKEYLPGPAVWVRALGDFLGKLFGSGGLGLPLTAAFAVALLAGAWIRKTLDRALLVALPVATFIVVGAFLAPFHVQPRHLTAVIPLLCLFAWPGAVAAGRLVSSRPQGRRRVAAVLTVLVCLTLMVDSFVIDWQELKVDSRRRAYDWIVENLSPEDRILLEDDGPNIPPNRLAIRRMRRRLARLARGPFTWHEEQRLDILDRYESPDARNIDLLGRPWWTAREESEEAMLRSLLHTDMGNPIVSRVPRPLSVYRAAGVRYVLSTSIGQRWLDAYDDPEIRFPSYFRFYRQLAELEPTLVIDPDESGGKGPIIWIHDLSQLERDTPRIDPASDALPTESG